MKKTRKSAIFAIPLLLTCFAGTVSAAPYGPNGREIHWVQPGGQKLTLRVFGDEYYGRTETLGGYTVVYNPQDQAYHFAKLSADGKTLKPTGPLAHLDPKGLKKRIDLPKEQILAIRKKNLDRFDRQRSERWNRRIQALRTLDAARKAGQPLQGAAFAAAKINAAPLVGTKVGLTILVQFPNDPSTGGNDPTKFPTTRDKMVRFCNSNGYNEDGNSGSVRDYYYDQSLGKMIYVQKVTPIVTLPEPRNYYNYDDYPTNANFRDTGEAGNLIIQDAVAKLVASGYDFSGLTVDAGQTAIATNVFFAGADSGAWAQGLWPHSSTLDTAINVGTVANPMYLSPYQITNIDNSSPVIGTFCHENGHLVCDFPDLYSYVSNGSVGYHCLMSAGNYNNDGKTPAPIDAYLRDTVGWANITDLTTSDYITRTLPTSGNVAYRIRNTAETTESFVVENRGNGDKWAKFVPDKGILIWHIDETLEGNANRNGTDPHFGVALMQADGRRDLEMGFNYGDTTDAFDVITSLFKDSTTPNAHWWDGSNSSVRVKVLSPVAANTQVQFGKLPPNTIIVEAPNGGEVIYPASNYKIRWEANISGNVNIDLYKGGSLSANIATGVADTGVYNWAVPKGIKVSENYTVVVSSATNPVPASDASDDTFVISDTTFPANNKMPYGWSKASDADESWIVTKSTVFEGSSALKSKAIGDGQTAAVSYTSDFTSGTVSFYLKVSSEVDFDLTSFSIDGVKQLIPSATTTSGLSGIRGWTYASYDVPAGKHTFTWAYTKDDSYADGSDAAWLDGVLLPGTTQEIDVRNSKSVSIDSGAYTATFPNVQIGKSSKPMTFTIKNTGNADLYGLKSVVSGPDANSFVAGQPGASVLKPGKSTTFQVKFAPGKKGSRSATVGIESNDTNESPFKILVEGQALGVPQMTVFQPEDKKLVDGKSTVSFGYVGVGQSGNTRKLTIKNTGSAGLKGLSVSKTGTNAGNFSLGKLGATDLAPGQSTTLKVTFKPSKRNQRVANLHFTSSSTGKQSFDIQLKGTGVPKNVAKSSLAGDLTQDLMDAVFGTNASDNPRFSSSSVVIDGRKYLTLTYEKSSLKDGRTRRVEVSPNLLDWYSGRNHTTILTDNESYRTVRDNTPVTREAKRYIRLKTSGR